MARRRKPSRLKKLHKRKEDLEFEIRYSAKGDDLQIAREELEMVNYRITEIKGKRR